MSESSLENLLGRIGRTGGGVFEYLGGMGYLFTESVWHFLGLLNPFAKARRSGRRALFVQMVRVGPKSIPIICLVLFFVGMIIAFQMAYVLRTFGADYLIPAVVGVSMLRELGPLLAAIVLTGFAGASMAAEIGTMVVSEEVLALETAALNPVRFLVMPRMIATTFMLFCLTIYANFVGVLGGFVITTALFDMSPSFYYSTTVDYLKMQDLITGLIKSVGFGALIALIACQEGLRVRGGAEGVGKATTQSVVYGIVAIISTDLFFSWLFWLVL